MAPAHVLTVDVEDWYHPLDPEPARWPAYEDRVGASTRRLLQVLEEEGARATFFVLGYVAERHPSLVREIAAAGHEVASHGTLHRFVYRQTPEEFTDDVRRSRDLLGELTGAAPAGYRAPYFSITRRSLWALPLLRELGFAYDASVHPVLNHRYGIPGAPRLPHRTPEGLLEVPPSTYPLGGMNLPCGGGAYFRLLPYGVTERLLARLEAAGERIVFYLHPWEIDPGQPRLRVPAGLRFRHYRALDCTEARLRRLLRRFRFGTVREVLAP
jgi:polysaccharide deacetylase family protein (PEP-CTERM system associated)